MSIDVMRQALEALEGNCTNPAADPEQAANEDAAITALRAAIEQAQEPVAWANPKWLNPKTRHWTNDTILSKPIEGWIPLYTAPVDAANIKPERVDETAKREHEKKEGEGHSGGKYHDNGIGWSWFYCGKCGARYDINGPNGEKNE